MMLDLTIHRTVNLNVRYKVATFLPDKRLPNIQIQ